VVLCEDDDENDESWRLALLFYSMATCDSDYDSSELEREQALYRNTTPLDFLHEQQMRAGGEQMETARF
jgi:hypothetical protein